MRLEERECEVLGADWPWEEDEIAESSSISIRAKKSKGVSECEECIYRVSIFPGNTEEKASFLRENQRALIIELNVAIFFFRSLFHCCFDF